MRSVIERDEISRRRTGNNCTESGKATMSAKRPDFTNPKVLVISLAHACEVLGIAYSTGTHAYQDTGCIIEGVPVLAVGKRRIVSAILLRQKLGIK